MIHSDECGKDLGYDEPCNCGAEPVPQPVSGEVAEWRVFFDTLNRRAVTPAEIVFARAHVERLAREVDRQRRIRASIEESRNKIRAEGIRNYERVVGQSDTLRARVAELTDEWHAAVREAGIAKARVAELETERAALDARLVAAVQSVPTSAPPARELTAAEIDRCSAAACMALNPDVGGRKPCEECFDAGRSYVGAGSPNPFRDANWRAAFDRAAAAIRAGKAE